MDIQKQKQLLEILFDSVDEEGTKEFSAYAMIMTEIYIYIRKSCEPINDLLLPFFIACFEIIAKDNRGKDQATDEMADFLKENLSKYLKLSQYFGEI